MNTIEQAEKEFAAYFGMKHGVMMCNGTATLHCCLLAAGVRPGDEVIVPALTMASPALAVRYCGAKPVYADVYKVPITSFTIDLNDAIHKMTAKTKACISVTLYGFRWYSYADRKNLHSTNVIFLEDNAQYINRLDCKTEYDAQLISYSFQTTKHITTGEGGMVLTNSDLLAQKVRRYGNLGYNWPIEKDFIVRPETVRHNVIGYNYRPSEAQAKLLFEEIPKIPERLKRRRDVARLFRDVVEGYDLLVPQAHDENHSYWTFAAYLSKGVWSDFEHLFRANGGDRVYGAWRLPYQEPALYDDTQHCPVAEWLQPRLLQFKTNYTDMKHAEEQAKALKKTLEEYRP